MQTLHHSYSVSQIHFARAVLSRYSKDEDEDEDDDGDEANPFSH